MRRELSRASTHGRNTKVGGGKYAKDEGSVQDPEPQDVLREWASPLTLKDIRGPSFKGKPLLKTLVPLSSKLVAEAVLGARRMQGGTKSERLNKELRF